jgi:stage V sporulation protein G
MKITRVHVEKVKSSHPALKGIATIFLDDGFAVHDIRIIEGYRGLFIAMPSRETATGGYRDIAHPITSELKKYFEKVILEEYERIIKKDE